MAGGDVTTLGPYRTNSPGMASFDTALTALSSGAANEQSGIITSANGIEFWAYFVAVP